MGKKGLVPPFLARPPAFLKQVAEEKDLNKQVVEDEARSIQNRLREIVTQVWDENAIFQRIMYKNQNQHRRTVYFRRLMQVRRDLLLLQSFGLTDVIETLAHCVSFSKQKVLPPRAVLGSLGRGLQSKEQLISVVQRRLLGAARLLQLMADPILNASGAIEGLLSQSFFMPFALTVLALLARFRVLLMQALYELIAAFNLVSVFVQKMQIPVPVESSVPLFLECSWDGGKLAFLEKAPPPKPPQELIPLPLSLSEKLPEAGWFVDDRCASGKEKLQSSAGLEHVLYEREVQFELLGEAEAEDVGAVPTDAIPTIASAVSSVQAEIFPRVQEILQCSSHGDVAGISDVSAGKPKAAARGLTSDVRAELESWKAELESWGISKADKKVGKNTKKRVAYVSVQIDKSKDSKVPKTGHPK